MIAERLAVVRERVGAAARRSGRPANEIEVVAVSKRQPRERLVAAYDAGQRVFGESRAQELVEHTAWLPSDTTWHMVGHLQRNKAGIVAPLVNCLHSLDSERLARAWAATGLTVPAFVQVNLAGESQKGGIGPADLPALLELCARLEAPVVGLMILPPFSPDPEAARPWFAGLRALRDRVREEFPWVAGLSMGMSDDFEVAIEEGSTAIRLGTTIFGPRQV